MDTVLNNLLGELRDKYARQFFPEAIYLEEHELEGRTDDEERTPGKVRELTSVERSHLAAFWGRPPEEQARVFVELHRVSPCTKQKFISGTKVALEVAVQGLFREYRRRIDQATGRKGFLISREHPLLVFPRFALGFARVPRNKPVVMMGTALLGTAGMMKDDWALPED